MPGAQGTVRVALTVIPATPLRPRHVCHLVNIMARALTACLECREMFKALDTDASNTIEAKELADGLKAQGYSISQQV